MWTILILPRNSSADMLQIWVYGNSYESFLVAVVNPNEQFLVRWAEEKGVTPNFSTLCENPKAKAFILEELTKTGKEKKVPFSLLTFSFVVVQLTSILSFRSVY